MREPSHCREKGYCVTQFSPSPGHAIWQCRFYGPDIVDPPSYGEGRSTPTPLCKQSPE